MQHCGSASSWDIACHLETFLCSWVSKSLKQRRNALCGNEPSNGLEMWRQLHLEYKGSGDSFQPVAAKFFRTFQDARDGSTSQLTWIIGNSCWMITVR